MPSLEPLKGFKYSPWPSVSTLAMFEAFFKYNSFPIALFVAFCAKADPTPLNAPVANVERTVFAKKGKAFAAKPARNPRDPPSIFILWTTWRLLIFIVMPFPSDKLLSFCSLVNWSKQEHYLHHTSLHVQDECSWGFCINSVFQFLVLIFRNIYWYVCVRHIYYMKLYSSQVVSDCQVFSTKIQLLSVLVCDNCFHFIDFI